MIGEVWSCLRSETVPGGRALGLKRELPAIVARHKRHPQAWAPHLENTRAAIRDALAEVDPAEPVLVLGAGALLDLPLDALNAHPAGALLVDAVLLPSVKNEIMSHDNIEFELMDVTGLLRTYEHAREGEAITAPDVAPIPLIGHSLIISCNLLSQLALAFGNEPEIKKAVELAHINALMVADCPALIITDYAKTVTGEHGGDHTHTLSDGLLTDQPATTWDWHIAPKGETAPDTDIVLHVGVWPLFSDA